MFALSLAICTMAIAIVAVKSTNHDCPTWMHAGMNDSDQCVCGDSVDYAVLCNNITREVSVLDCFLITLDRATNEPILGLSFYGCFRIYTPEDRHTVYNAVPQNKTEIDSKVCGKYNRTGRLCGACKENHYPLVYSYKMNCVECPEHDSRFNWINYIVRAFLPLTFFYIFVVLFKFNANSPKLHAYIFLSQSISSPVVLRLTYKSIQPKLGSIHLQILNVIFAFYGIWSLDFFRTLYPDLCLRVTPLTAIVLDYVIAFYPLLLILVTYLLSDLHSKGCRAIVAVWRPFQRCFVRFRRKWDMKLSMIDVFATFLYLTYMRIISVSFDLLVYVQPFNSTGHTLRKYLYYDADVEYFGPEHRIYGALAIIAPAVFNILPIVILLLYPLRCFQKLLNCLGLSHIALHTFVDAFTGYYKDGTAPGEKDHRYFAPAFFLLSMLLHLSYALTLNMYYYAVGAVVLAFYCLIFVLFQPYKEAYKCYRKVTVAMLTLALVVHILCMGSDIASLKLYQATDATNYSIALLITLPLFYQVALTLNWIRRLGVCGTIYEKLKTFLAIDVAYSTTFLIAGAEKRKNVMKLYQSI